MTITIPPSVRSDDDLVRISAANQGYRVEREEDGTITLSPTDAETGSKSGGAHGQLWLYAKTVGGKAYDSYWFCYWPGKKKCALPMHLGTVKGPSRRFPPTPSANFGA